MGGRDGGVVQISSPTLLVFVAKQTLAFLEFTAILRPMDALVAKIKERLKSRRSCTIFEDDLSRVWPCAEEERKKRLARVKAFAKAHDWSVTIRDPGIRATFRHLNGQARQNAPGAAT